MSTLVTADLHLNNNSRDSYRHAFIGELIELIKAHKVDTLLILGDLTHEKDCHNAELVNAIINYLYEFRPLCEIYVLRGNHDCLDPNMPFFRFTGRLPHVTWINDPQWIDLRDLGHCLFLPHTRDHTRDWKGFVKDLGTTWTFCHNTFDGADAGGGRRLRGIPTDVFSAGTRVISGDVHIPQELGCVTYVGAPYTINFGDAYTSRVLIFSDKKRQLLSVPVEGPQKRLIEIPLDVTEAKLNKLWKTVYPGDVLKVKVDILPEQYKEWPNIRAKVHKWAEKTEAIVHAVVPAKVPLTKLKTITSMPARFKNDPELIRHFGRRKSLPISTLKTGLWLAEKV